MNPLMLASAFALPLAAPSDTVAPPMDVIYRIEDELAKNACVGSLDKWWRHYSLYVSRGEVSENVISVHFVEAGHSGKAAGRFVTGPFAYAPHIDDSQHKFVRGEYDIAAGRFTRLACGWNIWSLDKPMTEYP